MGEANRSSCKRFLDDALLCEKVGAWCRGEPVCWQSLEREEWEEIVARSRAEGVAGLVYRLLPDCAPGDVREALGSDYRSQLAANTLYLEKLSHMVPALRNAGVRFAVVKGAALLATVYTDLGVRAMEDVDLLVHPEDVKILRPVLQHLGWQEEDTDIAGKQFGERFRAETSFVRQEGSLLLRVEAHLDAPGFYPRSRHKVWESIVLAAGAGIEEIPMLRFPSHLSYLCSHYFYHHCGRGLKWLIDIALLTSQVHSWHEVVVTAYEFGTTRPLHLALQELARCLRLPVPQHVVETLRFLPMPLSLRLLFEMCKRPSLHYLGIRLLDVYRAPNWPTRLGYVWRKLSAPRWRRRSL